MEPLDYLEQDSKNTTFSFHGEGAQFFGLALINSFLSTITLGLYRPWAITNIRKYMWNNTDMDGSRFDYHGKGKELFKGAIIIFCIAIIFIFALPLIIKYFPTIGVTLYLLSFLFIVLGLAPFALFSSHRYRVSKTSWRGIFMHFTGDFRAYFKIYFKAILPALIAGLVLAVIAYGSIMENVESGTFGTLFNFFYFIFMVAAYWSTLQVRLLCKTYLLDRTFIGKHKLQFAGEMMELFKIDALSLLVLFTLGLILPLIFYKRFAFLANNLSVISPSGKLSQFYTDLSSSKAFSTYFLNFLLLIFTGGIGGAWALINITKMKMNSLGIDDFDSDELHQEFNRTTSSDGTGDEFIEGLGEGMDLDISF
jgi:uncharacterized membrane protein YjgN (DUF898 family)